VIDENLPLAARRQKKIDDHNDAVLNYLLDLAKTGGNCPSNRQIAYSSGLDFQEEAVQAINRLERLGVIEYTERPYGYAILIHLTKKPLVLEPAPPILPHDSYPGLVEAALFLRDTGDIIEQLPGNRAVFKLNDYPQPVIAEAVLRRAFVRQNAGVASFVREYTLQPAASKASVKQANKPKRRPGRPKSQKKRVESACYA